MQCIFRAKDEMFRLLLVEYAIEIKKKKPACRVYYLFFFAIYFS